jgi:hypothetical protein
MAATDTSRTVGTENAEIKVGLGTTLTSNANSTTKAEDSTVSGVAEAIANTLANAGVLNSTIEVGTNGTLTGAEIGSVTAKATNTTGDSIASASNDGPTGGFINTSDKPNIIQTGLNAVLVGSARNTASAEAKTVGGSSDATADTGKVAGFRNVGLDAGTGTSMNGSAIASSTATAEAIGLSLVPGEAEATAGSSYSLIKGIYNDNGDVKIAFGENGALTGTAAGELSATAKNINGEADAAALMDQVAGIANDGDGLKISMGLAGDVLATGQLKSTATATTVTGPANAVIDVATIGGLIDRNKESDSSLIVGTAGKLEALALGQNTAQAEAVSTPEGIVSARVDNDEVLAVSFPKIKFGTDAVVSAGAQSIQRATAIGVNNGGDPSAIVAEEDSVVGINHSALTVGRDLAASTAEAFLTGIAAATGVTSPAGSTASAGEGSKVAGVLHSPVVVGRDTAGLTGTGDSQLQSTAIGVTGDATATAGDLESFVAGLRHSDVSIGRSGDVTGKATGKVISDANTVTGDSGAFSTQLGQGIFASTIEIGLRCNVNGSSALGGSAAASAIGGDAESLLRLNSVGIDLHPHGAEDEADHRIAIGFDGNITGRGLLANTTVQAAVKTGEADATSYLAATGLDLASDGMAKVGNKGNVSGEGDSGIAKVQASAVTGPATASGTYDVFGITATDEGTASIQAGPLGGNILGRALSEAGLSSSTTTGAASSFNEAEVVGIHGVDLQAGLLGGANSIRGLAGGVYDANSAAVTGASTADSDVMVAGLLGYGNTATVDGNVSGIATLSNTVMATTVSGAASATSSSEAIGIGGYHINILKDGVITASAISNSSATANSVMALVPA